MALTPAAWLAWLPVLLMPTAGLADEPPASPRLHVEIDGGSASLRAALGSEWSARATLSGRYGIEGADPARATLHRAALQAGVAWDLSPRAQLDLSVQRGMSPDMPSRAWALSWRLRY